ncbi:MAG TPA: phospholipid carrier-dependent glycosyltransferase [Burkholderiales bacterium]|nr:phospholipid carrier-dependent glycosyltransferase [Burkholderiales bacterium]
MSAAPTRGLLLALAVALALAWFGTLGHRKLIKADEGRYAEIPREMVATGDWLTPRLNGYKYFEKPPLQYWATAAAFEVFGIHEWAVRLWSALTGFGALCLVFYAGRRLFGEPAATFGAAVLASNALFAAMSQVASLDMGVSAFLSLAVLGFALAQRDEATPAERRGWMLAAWAGMALAVLSKGLIGVVLPGGALVLYLAWARDLAPLRRVQWLPGLALFLAIAAPWFVRVSAANPEFARFFFIHEHFERFLTTEHEHVGPLWYFVPVIVVGMLPWLLSPAAALWQAAKRLPEARFQPARFLLVWCAVVFVFFSLSGSKLQSYVLPLFPALALLTGRQLAQASRGLLLAQALLAALLGLAAALVSGLAPAVPAPYRPWLIAAFAVLAALALAAAWLARRERRTASVLALASGGLACTLLVVLGHDTLASRYSAYDAVQRARPALPPGAPFYAVNHYDHTLPFYLGRTVTLVERTDELRTSIGWEPQKFLPDLDAFAAAWRRDAAACAAFDPDAFASIRDRYGLEARVIVPGPRYLIACKP